MLNVVFPFPVWQDWRKSETDRQKESERLVRDLERRLKEARRKERDLAERDRRAAAEERRRSSETTARMETQLRQLRNRPEYRTQVQIGVLSEEVRWRFGRN